MRNPIDRLPHHRYLLTLERLRARIAEGGALEFEDSRSIGDKYTRCSWGMCSDDRAAWPDAEDHTWPDQFLQEGRVAPLDQEMGDTCPFDRQKPARGSVFTPGAPGGCFYRCMIFSPGHEKRPDRARALALYDEHLATKR